MNTPKVIARAENVIFVSFKQREMWVLCKCCSQMLDVGKYPGDMAFVCVRPGLHRPATEADRKRANEDYSA